MQTVTGAAALVAELPHAAAEPIALDDESLTIEFHRLDFLAWITLHYVFQLPRMKLRVPFHQ
jgi:hypothetical protein